MNASYGLGSLVCNNLDTKRFLQEIKPNYTIHKLPHYVFFLKNLWGKIVNQNDERVIKTYTLSPDQTKIAIDTGLGIVIVELATNRIITLESSKKNVQHVCWAPDSKKIVIVSENWLNVYDIDIQKKLYYYNIVGQGKCYTICSFSPDGQKISFVEHHSLHIIDLVTGNQLIQFDIIQTCPWFRAMSIIWSLDGNSIIVINETFRFNEVTNFNA